MSHDSVGYHVIACETFFVGLFLALDKVGTTEWAFCFGGVNDDLRIFVIYRHSTRYSGCLLHWRNIREI